MKLINLKFLVVSFVMLFAGYLPNTVHGSDLKAAGMYTYDVVDAFLGFEIWAMDPDFPRGENEESLVVVTADIFNSTNSNSDPANIIPFNITSSDYLRIFESDNDVPEYQIDSSINYYDSIRASAKRENSSRKIVLVGEEFDSGKVMKRSTVTLIQGTAGLIHSLQIENQKRLRLIWGGGMKIVFNQTRNLKQEEKGIALTYSAAPSRFYGRATSTENFRMAVSEKSEEKFAALCEVHCRN